MPPQSSPAQPQPSPQVAVALPTTAVNATVTAANNTALVTNPTANVPPVNKPAVDKNATVDQSVIEAKAAVAALVNNVTSGKPAPPVKPKKVYTKPKRATHLEKEIK